MNFETLINEDIKHAMRDKQEDKLRVLRAIKSAIILFKTSTEFKGVIEKQDEIKILQKLLKQRQDSAAIYEQQNRTDLLIKEQAEIITLQTYLPKQLTQDELIKTIKEIMVENNIFKEPKEMGKLIGLVNKKLMGQADGKIISTLVKELLA